MRTLRRMGIKTVAVYSEADRAAPHVAFADESVCIGPAPSKDSYLAIDKIIAAANATGAQGIHPGYGFLSENAVFSGAVQSAGLTFIGPSQRAIEMMGNKLAAKAAARAYEVPLLPGTEAAVADIAEAVSLGSAIGYPLLIKAAAGGGGKGMRIVEKAEDLQEGIERASSEAKSAFGDGAVFIEKYIASPKHIEIQIMADNHGNVLYLWERECSVQRRHQKVVEEAPSMAVSPEIRKAMGQSAVRIAQACQYSGAGTVEFLMDENRDFYFLEMNTRLQVEHPVTEMITGLDLVELQVQVARGQKLPLTQDQVQLSGHSVELRVYAEDPSTGFLPDTGTLTTWRPAEGPGIRVDSGYQEGMEVPVYYDPMLAKLVSHGPDRETAIERLRLAIRDFQVEGVSTTLPFGEFVLNHPAFRDGSFSTHFVSEYFTPELLQGQPSPKELHAALAALMFHLDDAPQTAAPAQSHSAESVESPWRNRARLR